MNGTRPGAEVSTPGVDRHSDEHRTSEKIRHTLQEMERGLDELMGGMMEAGDELRIELAAGLRRLGHKLEAAAARMTQADRFA